ncbi:nitric oxide reductase transcriptional regulator NorR [Pseudoalteromonas sp. DL2-H2.2]|uniref:nitric oxide reductase transcriptional regulator NorR n=1 Tax=Pseudoalteromonas sp. DL2-H2.2 TaxID=2908889 RepID=UPI001F3BA9D0|nr:nitric oxide reductase transcriptional regulator NorR [Pseudoalteromonas sp. DL2-H2.2]MCF2909571.1 nitric oxide reductase transcriptional regulator NorR [Pseudoalteromonas sp. DL2-H2.2]
MTYTEDVFKTFIGHIDLDQRTLSHLLGISTELAQQLPRVNEGDIGAFTQALVRAVQSAVTADAIAVLRCEQGIAYPLACSGLAPEAMGRRFVIKDHPRLAAIAGAQQPQIFAADCPLPDPYDGMLLATAGALPVHACMGFSLYQDAQLVGMVTFDSLTPSAFEQVALPMLVMLQSLVAAHFATALNLAALSEQARHGRAMLRELSHQSYTMIGNSEVMQRLKQDIDLVANSELSVLIQGETGTGKELVARRIHEHSSRAQGPFVQVNCASLSEHLAESEFFGHRKGAFTGADRHREGKFLVAHGGTLFLDEIGELPLGMQSKLLRALQSGEIQPVGTDKPQYVDVRIVAATNRDLRQEVEAGRFRADLYHRLSVFPLQVPPLRNRAQDIVPLAGFFVEQLRKKLGVRQLVLSAPFLKQLQAHDWPGNVRELEHVLSRAALKAKHTARAQDIVEVDITHGVQWQASAVHTSAESPGSETTSAPVAQTLKAATEAFQKNLIKARLQANELNWAATARELSVDRANLVRLAKRLGIETLKKLT